MIILKDKLRRNIVYIEDDNYYRNSLKLYDIRDRRDSWGDDDRSRRFPYLVKVQSMEEACKRRGFLLVLFADEIYYSFGIRVDDEEHDVYEMDRKLRNYFRNYEYVIIVCPEEFDYGHIHFSNIYVEFANKYYDTEEGLNVLVDKLYAEYSARKEPKYTKKRLANIERLRNYLKKARKPYITTEKIMKDLNVNEKWIQRYMKDMNRLYKNVGYNKQKRLWYVIKSNRKKTKITK